MKENKWETITEFEPSGERLRITSASKPSKS